MVRYGRLLLGVFILGMLLTGFFGWRGWHHYQYLQRVEQSGFSVESLRGWMTPAYIAERYHVPVARIFSVIGVAQQGNEHRSLHQLIDSYELDAVATRRAIEALILSHQVPSTNGQQGDDHTR